MHPHPSHIPSNTLVIGYKLNGEVFEYRTTVPKERDLEVATKELQMLLIEQVLDIKAWVNTREHSDATLAHYAAEPEFTPSDDMAEAWAKYQRGEDITGWELRKLDEERADWRESILG